MKQLGCNPSCILASMAIAFWTELSRLAFVFEVMTSSVNIVIMSDASR